MAEDSRKCETCKHFRSYHQIFDFDPYEDEDIGECHVSGLYPPDRCGITWEDSCEKWEVYE